MLKELKTGPVRFLYEATLTDGTEIFVYPDGTAVDKNGAEYKELTSTDIDGDIIHLGWERLNTKVLLK